MVELPSSERHPLARLGRRVLLAAALLTFVALVAYAGRDGYRDVDATPLSLLDAFTTRP